MASKRYIISRTLQAAVSLWAAITITFVLIRLMPGSPVDAMRSRLLQQNPGMTRAEANEIVSTYISIRPDDPLHVQYIDYTLSILQGDLGVSQIGNRTVMEIILYAMPWTIFISLVSLLLIYTIGIGLGAVMAYKEGERFDVLNTGVGITLSSIPFYIFATLLLWFLAYQWGLFPTGGRVGQEVERGLNLEFFGSALYHAALPIASLVFTGYGLLALGMRGNSIRVLGADYLRVARLRALPDSVISSRYVARNAILPLYTSMMISIGSLFGGSVILEEIFMYPGMGWYMFRAVVQRDYPLLMGSFLFITFGIIVGIYIADLTYGWIDPRASGQSRSESYGGAKRSISLSGLLNLLTPPYTRGVDRELEEEMEIADDVDDSPFDTVSDTRLTRKQRYAELFQEVFVDSFRILWSDVRARIGFVILLVFILAGTVGVQVVREPMMFEGESLMRPMESWAFPLGTDISGRNIFAQLIHATPAMLKMMFSGALFAIGMATLWGTFSGFVGGRMDRFLMTIADVLMTIPGLPLVIVLAVTLEPRNPYFVGIILTINAWAGLARALRSQVLTIREESYVEAARTLGIPTPRVMTKDIIPELMPLIMVNFVMQARHVIFTSVGLYFLGILPFSTLNWGVMLNFAYNSPSGIYTWKTAHWFLSPMLTILVFTLGLILFGQGCDRLFNPRIRARHAETTDETEATDAAADTVHGGVH